MRRAAAASPAGAPASRALTRRCRVAAAAAREPAQPLGSSFAMHDTGRPLLRSPVLVLSDGERATLDARPAPSFYAPPRIGVDHADAPFTRCVTELYASVLSDLAPPQQAAANGSASGIASGTASAAAAGGGAAGGSSGGGSGGTEQRPLQILDLCSSWASHLPAPEALGGAQLRVVGHGLNGQELAANERLAEWFVQDLDADPRLPALPAPLDAALCCNAVYYLKQLEAVASSVAGALAPGRGRFVVSFGADCYRERALAGMLARSLDERVELVTRVLLANGFADVRAVTSPACPDFRGLVATAAARQPSTPPPPRLNAQNVGQLLWAPAISAPLANGGGGANGISGGGSGGAAAMAIVEWRAAYGALCADAHELGIPVSAIPRLPDNDDDLTLELLQERQAYLQDMVASFLSAGL